MFSGLFFWFSFIYGICRTYLGLFAGSSGFTEYNDPLFWLLFGLFGLLIFPLIAELTLNLIASIKGFPVKPEIDLNFNKRIVYHPDYNISAGGIERLHPFDSKKYGRGEQ